MKQIKLLPPRTIPCYFCKEPANKISYNIVYQCFNCPKLFPDIESSYTCITKDGAPLNAHIYLTLNKAKYHLTLDLISNKTRILHFDTDSNNDRLIMVLDTIEIHPKTISKKLANLLIFA